jgi:RHS repeat-associated protein
MRTRHAPTIGWLAHPVNALGLGTKTTGATNAYYTRDPGGQLLSDRTSAGTYNYLFDGLGSVVGLTNSSGTVAKSYSYDPYGAVTPGSGTVDNPWQYAGGYWDTSAGVEKFGQRYYDPAIARWTQPDPIDATGIQQGNRYLYVDGDPTNDTDPMGLSVASNAQDVVYCKNHPGACRSDMNRARRYKQTHWNGKSPSAAHAAVWCAAGAYAGGVGGCAVGAAASAVADATP